MKGSYKLISFQSLGDNRGSLIAIEGGYNSPFEIKRVYYIFDTKKHITRGYHAHIDLRQIAIAVKGSCTFVVDTGKRREAFLLDDPSKGLLVEGLVWREMKNFSEDCVLLVVASEHYNEEDYIRDYETFITKVEENEEIK